MINGATLNNKSLFLFANGRTPRSSARGNNFSSFDSDNPFSSNASSNPDSAVNFSNFKDRTLSIISYFLANNPFGTVSATKFLYATSPKICFGVFIAGSSAISKKKFS